MAQASYGYFGVGVENPAAVGTGVDPDYFLPVKDVDFTTDTEFIEIREIRGSRQAYQTFDGPVRPTVTFTSSAYAHAGYGVILRGLMGDSSATAINVAGDVFRHTFEDAPALPSLTFERSDARATGQGILKERMEGCKIESVGFSCNFGEDVEMSVTAQGLGFPTNTFTKPSTFTTYPTFDPLIFTGATVAVGGVANNHFKSIDFEFTNTLERQEALNGSREAYTMMEGGFACSLSGTMVFEDLTMYNNFKNSTDFTITVVFQNANTIASDGNPGGNVVVKPSMRFHWPRVKVANYGIPMTAGEVMEADVEFNVSFDAATNKLVDIQIVNEDVEAAYDYSA